MSIDALLLHVPMVDSLKKKDVTLWVTKIAMGLFSISNELEKIGFNTEIINKNNF